MLSATSRTSSGPPPDEPELEARDSEEEQEERDDLDSTGRPYPTLAGHSSDDTDDGGLVIDEGVPADAGAAAAQAQGEENGAMAMDIGG